MKLILCVEDERDILENNRKAFEDAGFRVLTAENLAEAWECLTKQTPDAIVLDIMLPDGLGLDFLGELRERGNKIPVLLLTAWDKPYDVARGLRAGANDYLSKPFEYEVLLARVEAMFRNVQQMPERVTKGVLSLDVVSSQAFLCGADLLLTQKEFSLLLFFVEHEGQFMSAEYLYEKVWSSNLNDDKNAVQVIVSKLRRKIKNTGYEIASSRGKGYALLKSQ